MANEEWLDKEFHRRKELDAKIFKIRVVFAIIFVALIIVGFATGGISIHRDTPEHWAADDARWVDD